MHTLAGRLEAIDPDAGAALRVISYFDSLIVNRGGLESVVRGVATLSGLRAGLEDPINGIHIMIDPDGTRQTYTQCEAEWERVSVLDHVLLWLASPSPASPVHAIIIERGALAARAVLERTRSRRVTRREDPALLEVLFDVDCSAGDRAAAGRSLGIVDGAPSNVFASYEGSLHLLHPAIPPTVWHPRPADRDVRRGGVGLAVGVEDLARTVELAQMAAKFSAEGTPADPGPRLVHVEELGSLILLARCLREDRPHVPDVSAIEAASVSAPWMLATLDAFAAHGSLRAAASGLSVHHSTLQERIGHAERLLGWSLRDGSGHLRLVSALMVRRLLQNAASSNKRGDAVDSTVSPGLAS